MQFDDTLMLESDLLETELVGESDDLSRGTQVLEHMDCENERGGNDMEEIEITEVPSNGDKLLDGETNVSRIENFDNERETGEEVMEKKQLIPLCSHGKGTKVYVVNSDASKDGEDNPGQSYIAIFCLCDMIYYYFFSSKHIHAKMVGVAFHVLMLLHIHFYLFLAKVLSV